jgi:hypothetical protein
VAERFFSGHPLSHLLGVCRQTFPTPAVSWALPLHANCTIPPDTLAKRRVPRRIGPGKPGISPQTANCGTGTPAAKFQLHRFQTGANNQTMINIMKTIIALLSVLVLVLLTGCQDVEDSSFLNPMANTAPAMTSNPAVTNTPTTTNPNL